MSLAAVFLAVSGALALPPRLLESLCYVESAHRPAAIAPHDGAGPSYGVCQIKLPTARLMGFRGTAEELMVPENNIAYAGRYLAYQIKRYNNVQRGVCAYNRGCSTGNGYNKYSRKVLREWGRRRWAIDYRTGTR